MSYRHPGLGQVYRPAEGAQYAGYFVTELRPYNIGSAIAPNVPNAVTEALRSVSRTAPFEVPAAGWGSSGRIWVRFLDRHAPRTDADRAALLTAAIRSAERALGVGRLLLPGESVPSGATPTPTPPGSATSPSAPAATSSSAGVELSATEVQRALVRAGFSVGAAGADGDFGSNSRRALDAALSRIGLSAPYSVSSDRRSVTLPANVWSAIQGLPARSLPSGSGGGGGAPAPGADAAAPPPGEEAETSGGGFLSTPWPWVIGGVALAGAGAWLLLSSPPKKSAMAANRRRRHR